MYRFLTKYLRTKEVPQPDSIVFTNGVTIDMENKRIILPDDFSVHATGNLRLTADKHVIIKSGQGVEESRRGYHYSIWLNSDEDDAGRPLKEQVRIDGNGDDAEH
jgi:hypothetical protein